MRSSQPSHVISCFQVFYSFYWKICFSNQTKASLASTIFLAMFTQLCIYFCLKVGYQIKSRYTILYLCIFQSLKNLWSFSLVYSCSISPPQSKCYHYIQFLTYLMCDNLDYYGQEGSRMKADYEVTWDKDAFFRSARRHPLERLGQYRNEGPKHQSYSSRSRYSPEDLRSKRFKVKFPCELLL